MRKLWLIILMLGISMAASAESSLWAFEDEVFYHTVENCCGYEGRGMVTADGRYPCAVCAGEKKEYSDGMKLVERGGTIVSRTTEAYGESDEWESHEIFAGVMDETVTGAEAYRVLSDYANGDELAELMEIFASGESTEVWIREPFIIGLDSEKWGRLERLLNARHINGCWYQCLRAVDGSKIQPHDLRWRFADTYLRMEDGALTYAFCNEVTDVPELKIDKNSKEEQLYFEKREGVSVRIMREMDIYICVIREPGADKDLLEKVELRIAGSYAPIVLNGYMEGDEAVYVCVLSEGEYRVIAGGADVSLWRKPLTAGVEYFGSEYAVVRKGTGGECIIDRAGNIVFGPRENVRIHRMGWFDVHSNSRLPMPFVVVENNREYCILDGETLKIIRKYKKEDGYRYLQEIHFGAYSISRDDGTKEYFSLPEGRLLFAEKSEGIKYSGSFIYLQDGRPQRLVGSCGNYDKWLSDLYGNEIPGTRYNSITPLLWKGDAGVFLVAKFDPPADVWDDHYPSYYSGYGYGDTMEETDPESSWRCGLIDQDGKVIAEVAYTAFTMLSETQAELSGPEGTVVVNFE